MLPFLTPLHRSFFEAAAQNTQDLDDFTNEAISRRKEVKKEMQEDFDMHGDLVDGRAYSQRKFQDGMMADGDAFEKKLMDDIEASQEFQALVKKGNPYGAKPSSSKDHKVPPTPHPMGTK